MVRQISRMANLGRLRRNTLTQTIRKRDMSQAYSNPDRESDPHALPDLELFELNAHEVAERDEDLIHEYMSRHEFRLAGFNSRTRDAMFDAIVEQEGIKGGWFYWYCF